MPTTTESGAPTPPRRTNKCPECGREVPAVKGALRDHRVTKHGIAPPNRGKFPPLRDNLNPPSNSTEPDWTRKCDTCGESPIVPLTGMCGPCSFGEADTIDGNW